MDALEDVKSAALGKGKEMLLGWLRDKIRLHELKEAIREQGETHVNDVKDAQGIVDWMLDELDEDNNLFLRYYEGTDADAIQRAYDSILRKAEESDSAETEAEKKAAHRFIQMLMELVENQILNRLPEESRIELSILLRFIHRVSMFITPPAPVKKDENGCLTDPPFYADTTTVIGRETELNEVIRLLEREKALVLFSGFGGIGKTSLARLLFHTIRDRYETTAWVPYTGNLRDSMLASIRLNDELKRTPDAWWSWFSEVMNRSGGKKLFIIDNADAGANQSPEQDGDLRTITGWRNTTVLVTSRLNALASYHPYRVGFLDDDRCVELFYLYYENDPERRELDTVRKLLGLAKNHTLTVELLAKGANVEDDLEAYYSDLVDRGFSFPGAELLTDHDGIAARTIAEHLKKLFDRKTRSEAENAALYDFAVLPDGTTLTKDELKDWFGVSVKDAEPLARDGWLIREKGRYAMHPLVREILRLDPIPGGTAKAFVRYARDFGNDFIDAKHDYLELRRRLELMLSVTEETPGWTGEPDEAVFYSRIAWAYKLLGEPDEALEYFSKALAINKAKLRKKHPDTAATYNNIALVYRDMGDSDKALEFYQKALAIKEAKLGTDHPDTATTYNNIASVYRDMGDSDKALEFYLKDLAISEAKLGTDHPSTATTYNNIAGVYQDMGDSDKALEFYLKDLAISEAKLGTDHPDTAITYNNIAGVYQDMGDSDKALEFYQKALAIKEAKLGTDHPSTATTYNNISALYYSIGGMLDKEIYYDLRAYRIRLTRLGAEHPYTKQSLNNLRDDYRRAGKPSSDFDDWLSAQLADLS